ncbi:sodium:proton antiporter [Rubrobacter indicoceani]|uniref:sodium:proton antiporter n=1 Tax=Rubrobacter indicoceani TaxID=2051957 RepID=UPI000E5B4F05|nr:sodium:proton antiporter [Rubrobacter indicoceani]
MNLLTALVVAVIFASGTFLLLQRDLTRVVVGIILISNAAALFIVSSGLLRGEAAIYPLDESGLTGQGIADPLVQAMALTALVIGFALAALILVFVYRLFASQGTMDLEEVAEAELRDARSLDLADDPEREELPSEEQDDESYEADAEREGRTPR